MRRFLSRECLTPDEVKRRIAAARHTAGRLAERDALLILMAYRYGFRAFELIALRWDQIDLMANMLHVARLKHGFSSIHPLRGPELGALCAWRREQSDVAPYVPSPGGAPRADNVSSSAAGYCRAGGGTSNLRHRRHYCRGSGPVVSWPWRSSANPVMGQHARCGPAVPPGRSACNHRARSRDWTGRSGF